MIYDLTQKMIKDIKRGYEQSAVQQDKNTAFYRQKALDFYHGCQLDYVKKYVSFKDEKKNVGFTIDIYKYHKANH